MHGVSSGRRLHSNKGDKLCAQCRVKKMLLLSGLPQLAGPHCPLELAGSFSPSPTDTSLLLTAPLFCHPAAAPRRQLAITTWCTTSTVMTSSGAGPQTLQEAQSALSAESTLSLQPLLNSAQQQQADIPPLACQSSQPLSSPDELLSRLNRGQLLLRPRLHL